jgi:hypothetical protein
MNLAFPETTKCDRWVKDNLILLLTVRRELEGNTAEMSQILPV